MNCLNLRNFLNFLEFFGIIKATIKNHAIVRLDRLFALFYTNLNKMKFNYTF